MPREPKITPITRHDPRTFYATRATRTRNAEAWDLWSVEDGRAWATSRSSTTAT